MVDEFCRRLEEGGVQRVDVGRAVFDVGCGVEAAGGGEEAVAGEGTVGRGGGGGDFAVVFGQQARMMSRRLGIIGYPIGHSMSPVMFRAALKEYGLDITYDAWEVEPSAVSEFISEVRNSEGEILGFNATVPHKEAVMAAVDEVSEEAQRAGAVNTVVNDGGRLIGYNTDGAGFVRALQEEARFEFEGSRVLIIGAGGAARGVVMALAGEGVSSMTIANRTVERAVRLAGDLERYFDGSVKSISFEAIQLKRAASASDLIVQCTTMGMLHTPAEEASPMMAGDIPRDVVVYDLVYNPPETPFMREAERAGARVYGGLSMLVYQGAVGFEKWTGRPAPVTAMFEAARAALAKQQGRIKGKL